MPLVNKKILFISPNASASGAPKLLLNLAKALQETSNAQTDFLFKSNGLLLNEFKKLGNVIILNEFVYSIWVRIWCRLWKLKKTELDKIDYNKYDVILSNTLVNGEILPNIRANFKGTIITYVHELKVVTEHLTNAETLNSIKNNSNLFFVPSQVVKLHLIKNCTIEESKIKILPYYIPYVTNNINTKKNQSEFIVGGCGTVELRKGTDVFIQVVLYFRKYYSDINIRFVWKGADLNSLSYLFLMEDITKLGIEEYCSFLPSTTDMESFYNSIDIFLLTSREDPYPLVVLEAANAQVPSICFNSSGGAVDFIEGNGKVMNYLNVQEMAEAIIWYYNNQEEKAKDGLKAKEKLQKIHQDKKEISLEFFKYLLL